MQADSNGSFVDVNQTTTTTTTWSVATTMTPSSRSSFNANWWHQRHVVVPDWRTAHVELRWTWLLHTYGFSCVFFMLAFYAFFSVLNLRAQLSTRPYMTSINVFLCLLGSSRAVCFLVDPYASKGIMPLTIGAILWDLGFPCLLSAFGLIQLAFLQLTQLKLGPAKLRSKSCVSLIVSTHFIMTIATNIMWTFQTDLKVFRYISQTAFVCWGAFLCTTFLYGGFYMMRLLQNAPNSLFQRSDTSGFENKVMALGALANCPNLAAMTVAATVPSFLATPKIRITDENEQTYSYVSDNSHVGSTQNLHSDCQERQSSPTLSSDAAEKRGSRGAIYTVSEDAVNVPVGSPTSDCDRQRMVKKRDSTTSSSSTTRRAHHTHSKSGGSAGGKRSHGSTGGGGGGLLATSSARSNGTVRSGNTRHKNKRSDTDENLEMTGLLPGGISAGGHKVPPLKQDVTLMSILNHIAYVNRTADDYKFNVHRLKPVSRKSQIEKVLQGTYVSAVLGLLLCVLEAYHIYGVYGISAAVQPPAPLPWFIFQTLCRLVEFSMGCFIANITKQPVNRHHYPYSCPLKHRGGGLYF